MTFESIGAYSRTGGGIGDLRPARAAHVAAAAAAATERTATDTVTVVATAMVRIATRAKQSKRDGPLQRVHTNTATDTLAAATETRETDTPIANAGTIGTGSEGTQR